MASLLRQLSLIISFAVGAFGSAEIGSSCASDPTACLASEEVELLQSQVVSHQSASDTTPPARQVDLGPIVERAFKLTPPDEEEHVLKSGGEQCGVQSTISVGLGSGVTLDYNYTDITSGQCTGDGGHEDIKCCLKWGSNVTVSGTGGLPAKMDKGASVSGNIKVQTKVFGFYVDIGSKSFECALCGATCSPGTITLVGFAKIELPSFDMPLCPVAEGTFTLTATTFTLPQKMPLQVQVKVIASASAKYADGSKIASIDGTIYADP